MLLKNLVVRCILLKQYFIDFCTELFSSILDYLKDTVEHLIIAGLIYLLTCIVLYWCIKVFGIINFNREPRNSKRILFVIAHPDDECMFFGPTILYFTKKEDCTVYILCLSTGRNYGMGVTRKKELYKACNELGIPPQNIFIHNHTLLPDAMDVRWPTDVISDIVLNYIERFSITTLVTFDRYGVSLHNNHCSIYYAVANLILDHKLPRGCGVYVLDSTNIIRKYWLLMDIPLSFIFSRFRFMVDIADRSLIHKAMKKHASQIKWFRCLYMYFSRYMLINTLQQMNLVDIELDLEIED
ncbi:N-acetylglucosaminyl-phosphatidylinositol de-N-acetylase [Diorhabda carinulata]|uniref:N-acetylglucosaminyl-phosphatidylinositol de-N-acetylase n=1 Tax=Diorhabda carinulata TaxID=1163345 RepID=UPI0025A0E074|nr:N-acetylglucosaminyl-phosphatidylinositol de-N-acetylase [Diorhabda carinulata]